MARKKIKSRTAVAEPMSIPKPSKHEKKIDEMQDALYSLRSKIRPPMAMTGSKLLPKNLQPTQPNVAKQAKDHVDNLHAAMKKQMTTNETAKMQ